MDEEFPFTLPIGYRSADGTLHREGALRRARAGDEILPLDDPRVRSNRAYLVIIILSRVILRLGTLEPEAITPELVEGLYAADLGHLRQVYARINGLEEAPEREARCPHCQRTFFVAPP